MIDQSNSPPKAADSDDFIARLASAAETLMADVEVRLRGGAAKAGAASTAADRERDARTLANLVRLYEKLVLLKTAAAKTSAVSPLDHSGDEASQHIDDKRGELATLFARLAEQADAAADHR